MFPQGCLKRCTRSANGILISWKARAMATWGLARAEANLSDILDQAETEGSQVIEGRKRRLSSSSGGVQERPAPRRTARSFG
jgi:hypothetical protein